MRKAWTTSLRLATSLSAAGAAPPDATASAARELPRRVRRAPHDGSDLLERQIEHVVKHERHPLRGSERLQNDNQGQPHRVGEELPGLGVRRDLAFALGRGAGHRLRRLLLDRLLVPRPPRAQHVEAHPRDDGREPPPEVVDAARPGALEPQPRLLHRVVRLGA